MDEKNSSPIRIYTLIGFLLTVLAVYVCVLYSIQIVHGSEYLEQSVRTITRQETVVASRGILTDRNGVALVSNRACYNLTFDSSLLTDGEDENEAILRLIQLCRSRNVAWVDSLPVSQSAPYTFLQDGLSSTQAYRLLMYLQDNKWVASELSASALASLTAGSSAEDAKPTNQQLLSAYLENAGLGAETLLARMKTLYRIPADWSENDARAVLGVLYELAVRKLVNTTAYVFAEDVDTELISLITDGKYAGTKIVSSSVREYETTYAAHILGTVEQIYAEDKEKYQEKGYDMDALVGHSGVEAAFEDYLRGINGTRLVSTNAEGKVTSELYSVDPQPGSTVELTVDLKLQKVVEDALAETVSGMVAKDGISTRGAGAAVVQVGTGDILALASYPTYNPADYRKDYNSLLADPAKPLVNRATSGTYAPGSTFKPCTAIAGLQEGVITTSTRIRDTGKWYYPGASTGDYFYCWNHAGHGLLNVSQAITNSCNYFFGQVGYLLGLEKLNSYAAGFGLGQPTGIEIGEKTGALAQEGPGEDLAPWAAFGQANYLATPLQLSNYIATLVDGGKRYPAHLLREVKAYDNSEVLYAEENTPLNDMEISDTNLSAVKKGMHDLTTTGALASYFKSCVVEAGAKTGTAQVSSQKVNNGVFVCFAPYDDPQIAVAIVIEKGGTGAALASTAVKILNAYFTTEEIGTAVLGENELLR